MYTGYGHLKFCFLSSFWFQYCCIIENGHIHQKITLHMEFIFHFQNLLFDRTWIHTYMCNIFSYKLFELIHHMLGHLAFKIAQKWPLKHISTDVNDHRDYQHVQEKPDHSYKVQKL